MGTKTGWTANASFCHSPLSTLTLPFLLHHLCHLTHSLSLSSLNPPSTLIYKMSSQVLLLLSSLNPLAPPPLTTSSLNSPLLLTSSSFDPLHPLPPLTPSSVNPLPTPLPPESCALPLPSASPLNTHPTHRPSQNCIHSIPPFSLNPSAHSLYSC